MARGRSNARPMSTPTRSASTPLACLMTTRLSSGPAAAAPRPDASRGVSPPPGRVDRPATAGQPRSALLLPAPRRERAPTARDVAVRETGHQHGGPASDGGVGGPLPQCRLQGDDGAGLLSRGEDDPVAAAPEAVTGGQVSSPQVLHATSTCRCTSATSTGRASWRGPSGSPPSAARSPSAIYPPTSFVCRLPPASRRLSEPLAEALSSSVDTATVRWRSDRPYRLSPPR